MFKLHVSIAFLGLIRSRYVPEGFFSDVSLSSQRCLKVIKLIVYADIYHSGTFTLYEKCRAQWSILEQHYVERQNKKYNILMIVSWKTNNLQYLLGVYGHICSYGSKFYALFALSINSARLSCLFSKVSSRKINMNW